MQPEEVACKWSTSDENLKVDLLCICYFSTTKVAKQQTYVN